MFSFGVRLLSIPSAAKLWWWLIEVDLFMLLERLLVFFLELKLYVWAEKARRNLKKCERMQRSEIANANMSFSFVSLLLIKRQHKSLNRSNIMAKYDDYDWDELPSEVKAAGKVYLLHIRDLLIALTKKSKWNIV